MPKPSENPTEILKIRPSDQAGGCATRVTPED